MFMVKASIIQVEHATVGRARLTSTKDGRWGGVEWCAARSRDKGENHRYAEIRRVYGQGDYADFWDAHWEKSYYRGDQIYLSAGKRSAMMELLPPPRRNEKGEMVPIVSPPSYRFPNLMCASVLTWGAYKGDADSDANLTSWLKNLLALTDKTSDKGFVGFFYWPLGGVEIEFDKEFDYMPTHVRGYHRNIKSLDEKTSPDQFKLPWYEIRTTWKKADNASRVYTPVRVLNRVFAPNANVKSATEGYEVDATAVWTLNLKNDRMFELDSVQSAYQRKGPLGETLQTLEKEIDKIMQ